MLSMTTVTMTIIVIVSVCLKLPGNTSTKGGYTMGIVLQYFRQLHFSFELDDPCKNHHHQHHHRHHHHPLTGTFDRQN